MAFNEGIYRFENGGTISITAPGGSKTAINNLVAGTIRFTEPSRARIDIVDRSVMSAPLEGDQVPGDFEAEFRLGSVDAADLYRLLAQAGATSGGTAGRAATFDWELVTKVAQGGATAFTETLSDFWVDAGGLENRKGTEFDTIRVRGKYLTYAAVEAS